MRRTDWARPSAWRRRCRKHLAGAGLSGRCSPPSVNWRLVIALRNDSFLSSGRAASDVTESYSWAALLGGRPGVEVRQALLTNWAAMTRDVTSRGEITSRADSTPIPLLQLCVRSVDLYINTSTQTSAAYACFPTFRNVTHEFLRDKKALRTFYAAATTLADSYGAPRANKNDFYFSATGPIRTVIAFTPFSQCLRHCGTLRCVLRCVTE